MNIASREANQWEILATKQEIEGLRLCILEALEALQNEKEFYYRVTISRDEASGMLEQLSSAIRVKTD